MLALIGRAAEEAALKELIERARTGHGGMAVTQGEPGIGKSALAQSLAPAGFTVVPGKAWEFADAPPYFPLSPCLRALGLEAGAGGFALWEQVVEALARSSPTLWVLEDLHAADQQTLKLLCYLTQPLRALRAAVVVTTRDRDPRITPRTEQLLSRLSRDSLALPLPPLSSKEVAQLARDVPPGKLPMLIELCGGNPLFVIECARTLRTSRSAALPSTVRQLVLDQVSLLGQTARAQLEAGAVLGRDFSAALVARMGATLPARVIDDLASALRGGVIAETRPGHFVFSHALVRDAIYSAIAAERKIVLHAAAGAALATLGDNTELLVERTHHALEAGTPEAAALAERAIALEEAQGAFDRAYALAKRALPDDSLKLAQLAQSAGAWSDSRRHCEQAIDRARATGNGELLARAALLFGAELRPAVVDPVLVRWLEEALRLVPSETLAIRLRARLAAALQPAQDPWVPIAMARQAIVDAENHPAALSDALFFGGSTLSDFAPLDERIAIAERLMAEGDRARGLHACFRLAMDSLQMGDFARFETTVEEMTERARLLGHPRHQWRTLLFRSMRACAYGDFAASEGFLVEVDQMTSVIDHPALPMALLAHRLSRARIMQDPAAVSSIVASLREVMRHMPHSETMGCIMELAMRSWFEELPPSALHVNPFLAVQDTSLWHVAAEAVAACGTREQRQRFLAMSLEHPEWECVTGHIHVFYDGPVARIIGLLHASLGQRDEAERWLRSALERAQERRLRPWEARITFELARLEGKSQPRQAPAAPEAKRLSMQLEGDVWAVEFEGRTFRVKDTRGLQLLQRLMERPDEELHVLALANDEGAALTDSDAGEVIDLQAAKNYRQRLRETDDPAEREWLERELARGLDLSGDPRRAGSATERARINVQRRVKDAIKRLGEIHVPLGAYLARAVRTGTYCCYRP